MDPFDAGSLAIFKDFDPSDIAHTLSVSRIQDMMKDEVLWRRGTTPDVLHLLLQGRIGLFGERSSASAMMAIFGPGNAVGLTPVILRAPYTLSARMLQAGKVMMWPADDFRRKMRMLTPLACNVAEMLSKNGHALVDQINGLKLMSATERLASFLIALCSGNAGPAIIDLPAKRTDIASRLGVTPQSLSRAFGKLRALGVDGGGSKVMIKDVGKLYKFLGGLE